MGTWEGSSDTMTTIRGVSLVSSAMKLEEDIGMVLSVDHSSICLVPFDVLLFLKILLPLLHVFSQTYDPYSMLLNIIFILFTIV